MMTYMKSVKDTFWNWFDENQKLAFVLLGAIGLPLLAAVGLGIAFVILNILMWMGLSLTASVLVFSLMVLGACGGLWMYNLLDDNE